MLALRFLDSVRDLMHPENLHDVRIDTCAGDSSNVITAFVEYLDPTRFVIAVGGAVFHRRP